MPYCHSLLVANKVLLRLSYFLFAFLSNSGIRPWQLQSYAAKKKKKAALLLRESVFRELSLNLNIAMHSIALI